MAHLILIEVIFLRLAYDGDQEAIIGEELEIQHFKMRIESLGKRNYHLEDGVVLILATSILRDIRINFEYAIHKDKVQKLE